MSVMKSVSALLKAAVSMLGDAMDPVCQNKDAFILGKYKGYCVRMVPVVDSTGRVEKWIPNADKVKHIDAMLRSGKIPDLSAAIRAGEPPAQLPPMPQTQVQAQSTPMPAPVQSAPPVLPPSTSGAPPQPTFNPQGIPGI